MCLKCVFPWIFLWFSPWKFHDFEFHEWSSHGIEVERLRSIHGTVVGLWEGRWNIRRKPGRTNSMAWKGCFTWTYPINELTWELCVLYIYISIIYICVCDCLYSDGQILRTSFGNKSENRHSRDVLSIQSLEHTQNLYLEHFQAILRTPQWRTNNEASPKHSKLYIIHFSSF